MMSSKPITEYMPSSELLARPGEYLHEHLRAVSCLAADYAQSSLQEATRLAGLTHDIGKATTFFQKHILSEKGGNRSSGPSVSHHAYLSSVFAAWVAMQQEDLKCYALPIFLAVARHHGNLCPPRDLVASHNYLNGKFTQISPPALRQKFIDLRCQLKDLDRPIFYELCKVINLPDPRPFLNRAAWETIARLHQDAEDIEIESGDRKFYWHTNQIFSALIDADKKQAAHVSHFERKTIPPDLVDLYLESLLDDSPLNPLRQRLYQEVDKKIKTMSLNELYPAHLTLTAPTGSGKTLTAFNAALKLRARLECDRKIIPRIIYVLPYINLIEQNYGVLRNVLKGFPPYEEDPEAYLIEHHHLALPKETPFDRDETDMVSIEDRLLLTESWESEVIVTTFVQFFHTLVAFNNRLLKKFHNILNSIIILDEIQTLKAEHWPLIREMLEDLKEMGTTIIAMTATQPALLKGANKNFELAPSLPDWPARVQIERSSIKNLEEIADEVTKKKQSRLLVVNTIARSIQLYNLLKKRDISPLFYLSTNITPYERKLRIEKIRKMLDKKEPVTLVSTQVVEAGIDLDFEVGYREMGPLDALLQIAGRINRGGRGLMGHLRVIQLDEASDNKIYGNILPHCSRELLPHSATNDRELDRILQKYFSEVERRISQRSSLEILEAIKHLRYQGPGVSIADFNLIEEAPAQPVFVELNCKATELLKAFHDALSKKNLNEKRRTLRLLRPRLQQFMISPLFTRAARNIPPPLFSKELPEVWDIRHIHMDEKSTYYDVDETLLQGTGFKWREVNGIESQYIG